MDYSCLVRFMQGRTGHVYLPLALDVQPSMTVVARASGDPAAQAGALRNVIRELDIDQPVFQVQTLDAAREGTSGIQRLVACATSDHGRVT